jgi:hypothetical protein
MRRSLYTAVVSSNNKQFENNYKIRLPVLLIATLVVAFSGYATYIWQAVQPALASSPTIGRNNNVLTLYGKPYTYTGINAYELATYWGDNAGCGGMLSDTDLDTFFASLRPNSVVRFWAFQDLAMNYQTGARSWKGIDRVFASAAKYNQFLLPTIANHWNACDGGNSTKNDA